MFIQGVYADTNGNLTDFISSCYFFSFLYIIYYIFLLNLHRRLERNHVFDVVGQPFGQESVPAFILNSEIANFKNGRMNGMRTPTSM